MAQGPDILGRLPAGSFVAELHCSSIESNTEVCASLSGLHAELARLRRAAAGADEGLGVVAAGTVLLVDPLRLAVTPSTRYERMLEDYQLLVREQLICGTQVHVQLSDRDVAVAVGQRVVPELPVLLALSASSPFWMGEDSGYASARSLVWQRWPTAGLSGEVATAAQHDALVADLVAPGTISDPGMIYFDVRPSAHVPTLELRVTDACPQVDGVVLLAGLFRALVRREREAVLSGAPAVRLPGPLLRAAMWRASRSGLEGDLLDLPRSGRPVPAAAAVAALLTSLRPQLEDKGDWDHVQALAAASLARGSSAEQQRRAYQGRGRLTDVVDLLLSQTRECVGAPAAAPSPSSRTLRPARKRPAGTRSFPVTGTPTPTAPSWMRWTRSAPLGCGCASWPATRSSASAGSPSALPGRRAPGCSRSTWCRASSPRRTGRRCPRAWSSGSALWIARRDPVPEDVYASWSPAPSPDRRRVAFVSDRGGEPQIWLAEPEPASWVPLRALLRRPLHVTWSPTGDWLACGTAAAGSSRHEIWLVRPDGSDLHRVAGQGTATAVLGVGPWHGWTADGSLLLTETDGPSHALLVDPASGRRRPVGSGPLLTLLDISRDGSRALLRRGPRGRRERAIVDLASAAVTPLQVPGTGSVDHGVLSADGTLAFCRSDVDRQFAALLAVPLVGGPPRVLAERDGAELQELTLAPDGRRLVLLWNVDGGRSAVSTLDVATGREQDVGPLPRDVVDECRIPAGGTRVLLTAESWSDARGVWSVDLATGAAAPLSSTGGSRLRSSHGASTAGVDTATLTAPQLGQLRSFDGLQLSGWLYSPAGPRRGQR